jgi:polyisoprenoid-binding protein YceI
MVRRDDRVMTDSLSTQLGVRPGTYLIDTARSQVTFTATHVFGLKPVAGTMTIRSGAVTVAADPGRSTVAAEIDAASFSTDDPKRDKDVRGKRFLDTARYPVIGFRGTRLTPAGDGWRLTGVLSVRGGSTEVTLDLAQSGADTFTATTVVDRVAAGVGGGRAIIARPIRVRLTVAITAG